MIRLLVAAILSGWLAFPASGAGLDATAVNSAEYRAKLPDDRIDAAVVKLQVLLDRAQFSPGEIDGKFGENAQKALNAFGEAQGLSADKALTPEIWAMLSEISDGPVITDYKITKKDAEGPFLEKLPVKMEDMTGLKALNYSSPREAIAEKFHMSQDLLAALNPGKKFDSVGEIVSVANVLTRQSKLRVGRIEVDKSLQAVKAFAPSGELVGFFPATVGSDERPTPSGTLKVTSTDANPNYRYNPDYKFKGVKSKEAFTIKPGPNNPAGSYWIGLSAEGYGIHGTADPSRVSKSESHGCIRMTNWDVNLLGSSVKRGTPVVFIDEPQGNRKS
jgi:lipoprotein-anchoring transpeptidase ErfK/SrfK